MRFGIPDSSDSEDGYVSVLQVEEDDGFFSDESDQGLPALTPQPRTRLGAAIRDYLMSSESEDEPDSEDEVGDLLDTASVVSKTSWRSPVKSNKGKGRALPLPAPRLRSKSTAQRVAAAAAAAPSWQRPWEPTIQDLIRDDGPSDYTAWVKTTESEAWRHGHRVAGERRAELEKIRRNVSSELAKAQQQHRDREAEELEQLMQGLAVRAKAEEEDRANRFKERQAKLWADIDSAIKESERKHSEAAAAQAAAERKRQEEEKARIAAEEKAALERKAEAERLAKEKAEQEARERAERERQEQQAQEAEAKALKEEEERKAATDLSLRGKREWSKWVDIQKRMKAEVIEPVKANREVRTTLRPGMRLITRGLGQVVNTKESILRVTTDICTQLNSQLPSPPSAAPPVIFGEPGQLHAPYFYLLSHTAKGLIRQADSEVSAKPEAAFPLARIMLGIMLRGHAAFGTVLFARLVKKCPWVVPYWPIRTEGMSREEYEKSTGQGTEESKSDYIRRMVGIVRMYFAALAVPLSSIAGTLDARPTPQQLAELLPEPWRLPAAWAWAASAARQPLGKHPATGPLLLTYLDTVLAPLTAMYGRKQVGKLLLAIRGGVESGDIKGDTPATRENIKLRVEEWGKSGAVAPPKGLEW